VVATKQKVLIMDEQRTASCGRKAVTHSEQTGGRHRHLDDPAKMPEILGMSDRIVVMCRGREFVSNSDPIAKPDHDLHASSEPGSRCRDD
jgi:hypothetical protein